MTSGLFESLDQNANREQRIYGVAVAQVINNVDALAQGRVQVSLPWLPGVDPWARVAVPLAGSRRGTYFIPQIGDEVLVAFNHGDISEPYIVGSLWNTQDRPPVLAPTDAVTKFVIRTPVGHEIEIDDLLQSITIKTSTQQEIKLDPTAIAVSTTGGTASIKLDISGAVTIQAAQSIELKAPQITIQGGTVEVSSAAATNVKSSGITSVEGSLVRIN